MNFTIEMPDDLARDLEGLAIAQNTTVQQIALAQLRSLVLPGQTNERPRRGSPAALLKVLSSPSPVTVDMVEEMEEAIAGERRSHKDINLFTGD